MSSVYRDLEDVRNRLLRSIRRAGDIPISMEDFGARGQPPLEVSLSEVRSADVAIVMAGPRYGSLDETSGLSITHLEFREAQEYGIPVLGFILSTDPSLPKEEISKLQAFKVEIEAAAHTCEHVDDQEQIPGDAIAALKRFDGERALLPGQFGPFQCAADYFHGLLETKAPFSHAHALVGRQDVLDELKAHLRGDAFVAILPGSGGVGKSRILLELAANSEGCVFLGPQFTLKPEHLRTFPKDARCLIVDDAHRVQSIESLIQLAYTWSKRPEKGLKLILTCRPAGVDRLLAAVRFVGDGVLELRELPPLDVASDALDLAVAIVGDEKRELAKGLVTASDGNPLLITVGGRLLLRDESAPAMLAEKAEFQSAALNSLLSELPPTINGIPARRLLELFSAIGPVHPGREPAVFAMLAESLDAQRSSVVSAIAVLRTEHGLLVERGGRLRVSPDVLSDHLLDEAAAAGGISTGFIDEVFEVFGERYLSNILSNASELEWRLRSAGSTVSVSDGIWERVHKELPSQTYRERAGLLKEVEASAWVAPRDVWRIVSWMLGNPGAPDDPLKQLVSSPYSQEDVVRQVPEIIRALAWHTELSRPCAHALWDLSVGDDRALNATPDHPLRVLGDLLSFDPRKPPAIQERLLDGLEDALRDDVLEGTSRDTCKALKPLLSRTLGWSTRDGITITMHSGRLPADNESVRAIRGRAIELIYHQARSSAPALAAKAVDFLLDLLRPPFGMYGRKVDADEIASWKDEVHRVAEILLQLVADARESVVGYVAKRGIEDSVAARYWPAVGQDIEEQLKDLPDSEAFVLFDSLQPWAHLFRGDLDRQASEKLHSERIQLAANRLLKSSDSPSEIVEQLCRALASLSEAELNPNPWRLLDSLCDLKPDLVPELARTVLDEGCSPLQRGAARLYCKWFDQTPSIALDAIGLHIEIDQEDVSLGIADTYRYLSWDEPEARKSEHPANVAKLLGSKHWGVRNTAIAALLRATGGHERQALDVLIATDFGHDTVLLENALRLINEKHGIAPAFLTKDDIEALLQKLREVRELSSDHFHMNQFLQLAVAVCPGATVAMLLSRIEYAASRSETESDRYQPLPYARFTEGLDALAELDAYSDLLRQIRDRVLEAHYVYRFWIPQLFALVSNRYDATAMAILREWSTSPEPEHVVFAAFLTREAGPDFAFKHDDFVVECLKNAVSLAGDTLRRVKANLHAGACSFSYGAAIGESPEIMVQSKKQSEQVAEKYRDVPVAKAFYEELAGSFQKMIDENLAEDEEMLDQ
ncbi:DUF4062 domain-containing protein [Candidatus Bipolaricaulota bacterium]|nr:DUF4062 domain-containing protein [Candidatus Bipolaricaulota bacterium]